MSEKLSLRTNANGDIYVYMEDAGGDSMAVGSDAPNNVFALNVATTANVLPDEPTASMVINPAANGDLLFRPHGSGKTEFNTGDIQVTAGDATIIAGNVVIPSSNAGLSEGALYQNANRLLHTYGTQSVYCGIDAGNGTLTEATCINNTAFGNLSMRSLTTGAQNNAGFGYAALLELRSGQFNTAIGTNALDNLTTGDFNTGIGYGVGTDISTGSNNILLGERAGFDLGAASSSNINIGNVGSGADNNIIRIGTQGVGAGQQNKAFMAGIYSVTPAGVSQEIMIMDSAGQMGTSSGGSLFASSFATDSGTATPAAGVITMAGGSNINSSGAGSTVTFNLDNTVSVSGSVTGGTGLVATTGGVTATAGDIVAIAGNIYVGTATPGNPYDISIDRSVAGLIGESIQNTSNNAAAGANLQLIVEPATADAFVVYSVNGAQTYAMGIDNSDSDRFKISTGSTPSAATQAMAIDSSANVFMPVVASATNAGASTVPYIETATGQLATIPGGAVTMNTGTQSLSISSDASATTVAIATGGAVKGLTLGSTNSTSSSTLQSGSGALNVTSTNGALTINSGTGTLSISNDASATTVAIATGGAAKTVTLGSTTTTSSLDLKYGTSDFSLASATGNVMVALDTGEITKPLQPAFQARRSANVLNVTGDGTTYTAAMDTEVFDLNSDYNNGTYTFTAPVTGKYFFSVTIGAQDLGVLHTIGVTQIVTTAHTYNSNYSNWGVARAANNIYMYTHSILANMTAGDTATCNFGVYNSTKTVGMYGGDTNSVWCGWLVA